MRLIRNALRFCVPATAKPSPPRSNQIYTAPNASEGVCAELDAFAASRAGRKNLSFTRGFRSCMGAIHPVPGVSLPSCAESFTRRTLIESLNYQMRKIIKNRGQFPNDAAVVKLPGWRSATSKTNTPPTEPRNAGQARRPNRRTTRGRTKKSQLEESPRTTRSGLPRPHRAKPITTNNRQPSQDDLHKT